MPAESTQIDAPSPPVGPPVPAEDAPRGEGARPTWSGHPFVGLALGPVAGLVSYGWAWLWLRQEMADWAETLGVPMDVPLELAADFGVLAGSLALAAWLIGARTLLRPGRAVGVVIGAQLGWTGAGYLLFAAGQFPAWPGFAGPFVMLEGSGFVVRPTWPSMAGPLAVLVLTALAAWVGARFRGAPNLTPGSPWGHALVGVGTGLGIGAYVTLQVLVWPTEVLGVWPTTELLEWPFVGFAITVAVAWATSGRGRATVTLNVLAALALLVYASGTTVYSPVAVAVGVVTVAIAAAHRPFARTLRSLVA